MKKILICLVMGGHFCPLYSQQNMMVVAKPAKVLVEAGEHKQIVNLDFLVSNPVADTFTLTRILLEVFDQSNNLVHSRFLDNNGTAPSIQAIPARVFNGVSSRLFFNPFTEFSSSLPLAKLVYHWSFEDNRGKETVVISTVNPLQYKPKLHLLFPMKGRVLVYDAHDVASHHRRFDYEFAPIKGLGFKSNFMRYAYDFVLLDSGRQFNTDGKRDEDYFGWAKPVFAVGAGKVIAAVGSYKDDHQFHIPSLANDPMALYGNYVAIRHADSSVSVYAHLKQNSLKVQKGATIPAGQEIGAIGASGSSFFPHLHFEIRTDLTHTAEGLPSYFSNVQLVEGTKKIYLRSGLVETGNIIEAR
jgi:hypothetical protein